MMRILALGNAAPACAATITAAFLLVDVVSDTVTGDDGIDVLLAM